MNLALNAGNTANSNITLNGPLALNTVTVNGLGQTTSLNVNTGNVQNWAVTGSIQVT